MITYRMKSLKVKIIDSDWEPGIYSSETIGRLAEKVKNFIESGEYNRIADIQYVGCSDSYMRCIIIYEETKKD